MNIENLTKLAEYLEQLPENYAAFEMATFMNMNQADPERMVEYIEKNGNLCGTAACAVGHGPHAGVTFKMRELFSDREIANGYHLCEMTLWRRYAETAFGIYWGTPEAEWMFGGGWDDIDNTPQGAAKRIRYLLAGNSVPNDADGDPFDSDALSYMHYEDAQEFVEIYK